MRTSSSLALLVALVGCEAAPPTGDPGALTVEEALSAEGVAPPPGTLVLDAPDVGLFGGYDTWTVTGAASGNRIALLGTPTDAGSQACPPQMAPECTDLFGPPVLLGFARVPASGRVDFDVHLTQFSSSSTEVFVQAIEIGSTFFANSNVAVSNLMDPLGDDDGDGLSNGLEVAVFRTDPTSADSDGGGEDDLSEIQNGTDPNEPTDDVPPDALPVIESVTLTPSPASSTDDLVCSAVATDADGDAITLTYQFLVNGTVVGTGPGDTLSATQTSIGDVVTCRVLAEANGATVGPVSSNSVQIGNTPPTVGSAQITPFDIYETSVLTCTPSGAFDSDGDPVSFTYRWFVNSLVAGTTDTLDGSAFDRGDEITCEVTPTDGLDAGTPVLSPSIIVQNSEPEVLGGIIVPNPAFPGDTLTCASSGTSDADGDAVMITFGWAVNSLIVGSGATFDTSGLSSGDVVECGLVPFDGTDEGSPLLIGITLQ